MTGGIGGRALAAAIDTATAIGARLVKEAIWVGDQCNWVGADVDDANPYGGYHGAAYRALGPNLYGGTAGVAVFLAELADRTGETDVRRTALGAIRQALARSESRRDSPAPGFYGGSLGTAFAAVRVACALGSDDVRSRAGLLLARCLEESRENAHFDIVSGRAGELAALLALAETLGDTRLLDEAADRGEWLLNSAAKTPAGYSWNDPGLSYRHNLCGFAHGAAGAGYALVELFSSTAEDAFRREAERAFAYERSWFDPETGNWPDLRFAATDPSGPQRPPMVAWCHGAAGIALSRLRAFEILGDERYKGEAATALETTAASVERAVRYGPQDFSLCHGLAGNADVLLVGAEMLGGEWASRAGLAVHAAELGIERFADERDEWPCGVPTGETQNLFLGLAGIGYFYL
jgi:lantibiotic modifying enzyme